MLLTPNANQQMIIYVIRIMDRESAKTKVLADSRVSEAEHSSDLNEVYTKALLFDNLMLDIPLPIFWKDKNRRFLGASQYFLDYYGFKSLDDILGKTDEDMEWHPNNEVYQRDEEEILKSGMIHLNVPGRCIVKGESREILATKWPTYKEGRISGLMGYFLENKFVPQDVKTTTRTNVKDQPLHLKTASQFIDDLIDYETDYKLNRVQFGVMYIWIPEVKRISDNYGRQIMYAVLLACSKAIAQAIGNTGSVAYVGIGQFAIASAYVSSQKLLEKANKIREAIDAIRQVNDIPCSLYAKVRVLYSEDVIALREDFNNRIFNFDQVNKDDASVLNMSQINEVLTSIMDTVPIGCYILKMDHTVLYWNHKAEELLGFSAAEMQGKKCIDMPLGCSFVTGNGIPASRCPAVLAYTTGKSQSLQMFMRTKEGKNLLIRNSLVPLKGVDGKVRELVSFFFPLTDEDYGPEFTKLIYRGVTKDPMTGLPGRKYMENSLEEAMELYARTGKRFALMVISLDYFHDLDPEEMKNFGEILCKYSRKIDQICRWSDDEIVALLKIRHQEDIEGAARRFLRICRSTVLKENVTDISIGITIVREGDDLQRLLTRANKYMYKAKKQEENKIVTDFNANE
jgi:diguanylate cyclase (GGDEF)-like protein